MNRRIAANSQAGNYTYVSSFRNPILVLHGILEMAYIYRRFNWLQSSWGGRQMEQVGCF